VKPWPDGCTAISKNWSGDFAWPCDKIQRAACFWSPKRIGPPALDAT